MLTFKDAFEKLAQAFIKQEQHDRETMQHLTGIKRTFPQMICNICDHEVDSQGYCPDKHWGDLRVKRD